MDKGRPSDNEPGSGGGGSTTIIVAVIGLVGALGTALIANPALLQSLRSNLAPAPASTAVPAAAPAGAAPAAATTPAQPATDTAKITAISPALGTTLSGDSSITMTVHYRLVSSDTMLLVPSGEAYFSDDRCASGSHQTIATNNPSQVPLKRGEGDVSIVLNIPDSASVKNAGPVKYISARASFWSGFDSQSRVIVNTPEVWDPRTACYPYRP